jgi:hypothetical protein
MRLYNSFGPNPKVVRVFIAEKDVTIPLQKVDLRAGENRQGRFCSLSNSISRIIAFLRSACCEPLSCTAIANGAAQSSELLGVVMCALPVGAPPLFSFDVPDLPDHREQKRCR